MRPPRQAPSLAASRGAAGLPPLISARGVSLPSLVSAYLVGAFPR